MRPGIWISPLPLTQLQRQCISSDFISNGAYTHVVATKVMGLHKGDSRTTRSGNQLAVNLVPREVLSEQTALWTAIGRPSE